MLDPKQISLDFIAEMESYGPYGIGFAKPRFLVSFERVPNVDFLGAGEKHLKFDRMGYPKMIAFGLGSHYQKLRDHSGPCHFVIELEKEAWKGKESVTLHVRDIALA